MTRINKIEALERLDGNLALYNRVAAVFLKDTPNQLQKLESALQTSELTVAARVAHSLTSAARSIGAETLGALSAQLETALASRSEEAVRSCINEIRKEFGCVEQELRSEAV